MQGGHDASSAVTCCMPTMPSTVRPVQLNFHFLLDRLCFCLVYGGGGVKSISMYSQATLKRGLPYVLGGLVRIVLIYFNKKAPWISDNVAISTPLNSWKRVTEGISLYRRGLSPYSGEVYHESPILLVLFDFITNYFECLVPFLFVLCDLLTALALSTAGGQFAKDLLDKQNKRSHVPELKKWLLHSIDVSRVQRHVAILFLFHPYSLLACMALTTTVWHNLTLALVLYLTSQRKLYQMLVFVALASYQSLYPAVLVLPCCHYILQRSHISERRHSAYLMVTSVQGFFIYFGGLLYVSSLLIGDWSFLRPVYGCITVWDPHTNKLIGDIEKVQNRAAKFDRRKQQNIRLLAKNFKENVRLQANDLTPNIGLFWYFFTEMFEHFREYFICAFQINSFIYVIPLMLKFRRDDSIVIFTLLGLMCIFKSYPSVGDIALYTSLLPLWSHLYRNMRQTFIVGCFFLSCSVLGPVQYYLWIYAGSANANFFFGTTLAFNVAQIFLITDILFAHIKREYHLLHGPVLMINDKPGKLVLK